MGTSPLLGSALMLVTTSSALQSLSATDIMYCVPAGRSNCSAATPQVLTSTTQHAPHRAHAGVSKRVFKGRQGAPCAANCICQLNSGFAVLCLCLLSGRCALQHLVCCTAWQLLQADLTAQPCSSHTSCSIMLLSSNTCETLFTQCSAG
jgi:hypothetical protein